VKVHDLLLEALEEWAERHGITAPMRVPSERPRRSSWRFYAMSPFGNRMAINGFPLADTAFLNRRGRP